VYEKYPISGIKQSYRHHRETKTVVMPLLIVSLMAAMAVFFVKSKPVEEAAPQEVVSIKEDARNISIEPVSATGELELPKGPEGSSSDTETEASSPEEPLPDTKTVSAPPESTGEFTAWMTPLALDTYIRLKNQGYSESFWQRGHWITAVEGRQESDSVEFRIALDKIPDLNRWQWQYRVNQSTKEFARTSREFADQGFKLVHTQSFAEPDGTTKFQAVWQRELSDATPVVETRAPTAPVIDTPRILDVNNLRFR